ILIGPNQSKNRQFKTGLRDNYLEKRRDIDFHFFRPNKDTVREMPADCSSYKHGEKRLFSPSSPWLHTTSFFPHKSPLSSVH
ncbi:hypothetical protein ACK30A_17375, partial [Aeromonas caviae]